jgi:hypothetical protein
VTGPVLARVRRVLTGHAERAFIHAVDDDGRELKLEVPPDAVRDVDTTRSLVLMISWSLHPLPRDAEPATSSVAAAPPAAPTSAIDAEFMALMARSNLAAPRPPAAPASDGVERQLAELLGIAPRSPT